LPDSIPPSNGLQPATGTQHFDDQDTLADTIVHIWAATLYEV
jgi:hypothetical protein